MSDNNSLSSILDDLYGESDETIVNENSQAQKAATPSKDGKVTETEMSDEDIALSVNIDLPAAADEQTAAPEKKDPPKKKTAEEIQAIRDQAEADVKSLREAFPELSGIRALSELSDPQKYLSYRNKGLTAEEAYTLTYAGQRRQAAPSGTRRPDLRSSPSGGGPSASGLSMKEMDEARKTTGLDDETIRKYYRKF